LRWPKVRVQLNRITVSELVYCLVLTEKLLVISRFNIPSVVLIEIIKLIVHIDWARYFREVFVISSNQRNCTYSLTLTSLDTIVPYIELGD